MSEKSPKDYRRYPQKTRIFDGVAVDFKRVNDDFSSALWHPNPHTKSGYQEMYPSVYSIEIPNEGYVKLYNFFFDIYLVEEQFINYRQFNLYNTLAVLRNCGYYLSITGNRKKGDAEVRGLAQLTSIWRPTLEADIDHLEDCMLLHRVRRLDLRGNPNEIIVHSPFTPKQIYNEGRREMIIDRVSRGATKARRREAMITGTKDGRKFSYVDRKAIDARFLFDYGFIKKSFSEHAQRFADFALAFFKKFLWLLETDKSTFQADFREALKVEMSRWGITRNDQREQCYQAANKFRTIYCPLDEELYA